MFDKYFKLTEEIQQQYQDKQQQEEELNAVKNYLSVYHDEDDNLIKSLILASKKYILDYTGLTEEQYTTHENSLKVALYMLVSQFYDNRSMQSSQLKENSAIDSILGLYRSNLVPEEVNN